MNYEKEYKESMERTREFVKRGSLTIETAKAIFDNFEMDEDEVIRKKIIKLVEKHSVNHERCMMTNWLNKQRSPKWLYRLEYKDRTCGLWYNGDGKWCFEQGIGSVEGCKTKDLPMDHDERYKQDGRDWFSSCSRKEDLMHWYSLEDAKKLIEKGFVFTRYLATEYHEYEQETVFIKDTALVREEIDIFELFGKTKPMFKEGDWIIYKDKWAQEEDVLVVSNPDSNGTSLYTVEGQQKYYLDWGSLKSAKLWTLQDSKPGDILVSRDKPYWIGIFKQMSAEEAYDGSTNNFDAYCYVARNGRFCNKEELSTCRCGDVIPADREQRNFLFQKIKETGYCWDAENLELKKIGEDKSKFKREDWIVNNKRGTIHQIKNTALNLTTYEYGYDLTDGGYVSTSEAENYHVWTINDAIPGDVLVASDGSIFLYNGYDKDKGARYFVSLTQSGEIEISNGTHYWENIRACHPSTKEERDILFTKLKEAGYDWDSDKLRLINLKESDLDEENDWTKNLNAVLSYINDEDLKEWLKKQLEEKL